MQISHLSSTVSIKTVSEDEKKGVFEIEGLFAGYGLTLGNSLRRVLLSSLPGAAITEVKIKNASHEFSVLPGVKEDVVGLVLNFKKIRFRMHTDEPQILELKAKGEKVVVAGDITQNSQVEIVNKDEPIATLTAQDADFDVEIKVERGLGYSPVEARKEGRFPIGTVAIDALFTPVRRVDYKVEDMRVGERTDYNRLRLEVETDGTISPSSALHKAANILKDHFDKVGVVEVKEFEVAKTETAPEPKKKGRPKKEPKES